MTLSVSITIYETFGAPREQLKFDSLIEHVTARLERKLQRELNYVSDPEKDHGLYHAVLFMLPTFGKEIPKEHIDLIHKLKRYVMIVPIIPKADCFTRHELDFLKKKVLFFIHSGLTKVGALSTGK